MARWHHVLTNPDLSLNTNAIAAMVEARVERRMGYGLKESRASVVESETRYVEDCARSEQADKLFQLGLAPADYADLSGLFPKLLTRIPVGPVHLGGGYDTPPSSISVHRDANGKAISLVRRWDSHAAPISAEAAHALMAEQRAPLL